MTIESTFNDFLSSISRRREFCWQNFSQLRFLIENIVDANFSRFFRDFFDFRVISYLFSKYDKRDVEIIRCSLLANEFDKFVFLFYLYSRCIANSSKFLLFDIENSLSTKKVRVIDFVFIIFCFMFFNSTVSMDTKLLDDKRREHTRLKRLKIMLFIDTRYSYATKNNWFGKEPRLSWKWSKSYNVIIKSSSTITYKFW